MVILNVLAVILLWEGAKILVWLLGRLFGPVMDSMFGVEEWSIRTGLRLRDKYAAVSGTAKPLTDDEVDAERERYRAEHGPDLTFEDMKHLAGIDSSLGRIVIDEYELIDHAITFNIWGNPPTAQIRILRWHQEPITEAE